MICPLLKAGNFASGRKEFDDECRQTECALWIKSAYCCGLIAMAKLHIEEIERQELIADAKARRNAWP